MEDVHQGKDGWLFLVGDGKSVYRYYTDLDYFQHSEHVEPWVRLLRRRAEIFARAQIRYFHICAPDKMSVYPERVLLPMPFFDRHPINLVSMEWAAQGGPPVLINPLPIFAALPARDALYMKTDTHWTYHASAVVLGMVLRALGTSRDISLRGREVRTYRHVWDLASRLAEPMDEENVYVVPRPEVRRVRENELAKAFETRLQEGKWVVHEGINVVFRNDAPGAIDETVVIFGDSFFEFRPSTATQLFADTFREVHFVWSHDIDFSYVARADATVVITEMSERFMIQVPNDRYDVVRDEHVRMGVYADAE